MASNEGLLTGEQKGSCKGHGIVMTLMALMITAITVITILTVVTVYKTNSLASDTNKQVTDITDSKVPSRYAVPHTSVTPVVSQGSRGTCWNFAQVGVLEGSYKQHGFEQGWLNETEYVKFSEQGFAKRYVDYCQANQDNPWCEFGGMLQNTTDDGEIQLMYYMHDDVNGYLFPDSVCPYELLPGPNGENEHKCEHEAAAVAAGNPIDFEVTGIRSAYDVEHSKELLFSHKLPCGFASMLWGTVMSIPCDDPDASAFVRESNECKTCIWQDASGACSYQLVVREYDWGGKFVNKYSPHQGFLRAVGGHAQTLVGYNDDFVSDLSGFGNPADFETGAFILKNSWGPDRGHSIEFLMGETSMIEERHVCPNHGDPEYWIAMNPDCLAAEKDPSKCMQDQKQLLGDEWRHGATALNCTALSDSFFSTIAGVQCNTDHVYYMSTYNSSEYNATVGGYVDGAVAGYQDISSLVWADRVSDDSDMIRFRLIDYNPADQTFELVYTDDANWWLLGMIFSPIDFVANDELRCGYYPIPYSTQSKDAVHQAQNDKDTSSITCFDIEWTDTSYAANDDGKLDYSYLKESTKNTFTPIHNQGSFDIGYPLNNKAAQDKIDAQN